MAEETPSFAGIPLSIQGLADADPAISFPGEVVISEFRMASEAYAASVAGRNGIPVADLKDKDGNGIPQWTFQVNRLDAISVNTDGSEEPFSYWYTGIDLKKWNSEQGLLIPISSRNRKEQLTISSWENIFGTLQPPTRLVGLKAEFDYWPLKAFGSFIAKRVLIPTSALDASFQFTGEVRRIPRRPKDDEDQGSGTTDAVPTSASVEAQSSELLDGVKAQVLEAINGLAEDADQAALIQAIPSDALTPSIVTAITSGNFVTSLVDGGVVKVEDGKLVVA